MFAGHDTTAMAISWTLYMLGLHPEIQDKVRDEVDQVFDAALEKSQFTNCDMNCNRGDGDHGIEEGHHVQVTAEMIKDLKYLDCVLKEVQRIYPTAPFVGRQLTEDTVISGYTVPKVCFQVEKVVSVITDWLIS